MAPGAFFERFVTPYALIPALVALIVSTVIIGLLNPKEEIKRKLIRPEDFVAIGMSFNYRPGDVRQMFDAFNTQANGKELKEKYRRFFYYDFIYALCYALSAAVIILYLLRSSNTINSVGLSYLWLLPILAGVFDYAENISMLFIMNRYDKGESVDALFGFSRLMTRLKLIFIGASLLVIVILSINKLIFTFKGKPTRQSAG